MSKRKSTTEFMSDSPSTWVETLGAGADYAILTQALVSELFALFKDATHVHEVIFSGLLKGIETGLSTTPKFTKKGATLIEQRAETTLQKTPSYTLEEEKKLFKEIYSEKKKRIKKERETIKETDIAKLILKYGKSHFNVFNHVVRKYLEDPNIPEEEKKSVKDFSKTIDKIRLYAQSTTAGSLSRIYQLSESLGKNLSSNAQKIISPELLPGLESRTFIRQYHITQYIKKLYSKAAKRGITSLLPLENVNELGKFIMAGAYESLKSSRKPTKAPIPRKKINKNALKRKEEKRRHKEKQKDLRSKYGTDKPTSIQILGHLSGYDEWHEAYSWAKKHYSRYDQRVEKEMDSIIAKSTSKTRKQIDLEGRRTIKQEDFLGKTALSFYDSIRAVCTASTLVTKANLYRTGRWLGGMSKDLGKWLDYKHDKTEKEVETTEKKTHQTKLSNARLTKERRNSRGRR